VGDTLGEAVGAEDGFALGIEVGPLLGSGTGAGDGFALGIEVGTLLGSGTGAGEGTFEGLGVGRLLGEAEGDALGASQRPQRALQFALTSIYLLHLPIVFFRSAQLHGLFCPMPEIKNLSAESSHSVMVESF